MLLAAGVEPGVIEKVLGAAEPSAVGEEKEFGRDERRRAVTVGRDDIGDALPARGDPSRLSSACAATTHARLRSRYTGK